MDCIVHGVAQSQTRLNDFHFHLGCPGGLEGKASACNVGDLGLIPGLGRSSGEGKGYPLQYSGLENSMDYSPVQFSHSVVSDSLRPPGLQDATPPCPSPTTVQGVTKCQTPLSI